MNVETETAPDMSDPAVLDERIASVVNTLIQVTDPRLIVNALLTNAAGLCQLILHADKATPAHVAHAFSSSLVQALSARDDKGEPRIEVVPANTVIDLSKRQ